MLPKVSVIIPIYNCEKVLDRALDSIIRQTYTNLEIIVVDDSSTDNSYCLAKKYESDILKVYKQPNGGAAVARNMGLSVATGKYIQFLDADDFLSEAKIEKQVQFLEDNPGHIAVCNYIEFFNENLPVKPLVPAGQERFIFTSSDPAAFLINLYGGNGHPNFIQTNSWLVPKSIIDVVGGWRAYRCPDDDGEFFARVILASKGIIYVPGVFNFYRRTVKDGSLSSSTNRKYLQNSLITIDLKHKYLSEFAPLTNLSKAIATQYLLFAVFTFPKHKVLSAIAYKRYKRLSSNLDLPILGGSFVELIKHTLGWKAARYLKYYLRENSN